MKTYGNRTGACGRAAAAAPGAPQEGVVARELAPLAALAAFPLSAGGAARYKSNSDLDAYVRSWAAGGTSRRCGDVGSHGDCSWLDGFGPIDVACTIHVDRVGLLDDKRGPALTLKFHDGEELSISTENAHKIDRFIARPALCEYVPEHRPVQATDAGLVMVSNSPSYLLRLWPPFLNKLLYATDAGLRTFCGSASCRRPREAVITSLFLRVCRSRSTTVAYEVSTTRGTATLPGKARWKWTRWTNPMASNHYRQNARGPGSVYYVDLDAVMV